MREQGWIKLHRNIVKNKLWLKEPFTKGQAWVDILLRVNHRDNEFMFGNQTIEILKGQTLWSVKDMAERWKWSRKKAKTFLEMLKKEQQIDFISTTKYTLLTVVNWDLYQNELEEGTTNDCKKNIKRTSKEHQKNTNKNDKECVKNEKNNIGQFSNNEELNNAIKDFIEMRKSLKKPMTDRAVLLMLNKLRKLSNDEKLQIQILEQSIMNSWHGIYELKNNKGECENGWNDNDYGKDSKSTEEFYDFTKYGGKV